MNFVFEAGGGDVGQETLETDILIIGAGFAGAATAYHLSRQFQGSITLVEQEQIPGFHASGRNASMLLQSVQAPEIRRFVVESRKQYEKISDLIGFQATGSLLLGKRESLETVREPELLASQYRDPARLTASFPLLSGHRFESGLWTSTDGVIDISRLLSFYLDGAREAGVRIRLDWQVQSFSKNSRFRVGTSHANIGASIVVNAAGAWAEAVGSRAGAATVPLFPLKRHLFLLEGIEPAPNSMPFVWDMEKNFYFRPESGGLLFSVCDEEPASSLEPTVSAEISELVAEVIWRELPALQDATQRSAWSCFRTQSADRNFVIGWDRNLEGFFWVAGLGGHGMGASWEVGRQAAQAILRGEKTLPEAFLPSRRACVPGV